MKKILIVSLFTLFIIIFIAFVGYSYIQISCGDRLDRIEANKVPRYPYASFWRIHDSTHQCFGDGEPDATINFHSDKKPLEVLTFFKEELPKQGWHFTNEGDTQEDLWAGFAKNVEGDCVSFYLTARYYKPSLRVDWNYEVDVSGRHPDYKSRSVNFRRC